MLRQLRQNHAAGSCIALVLGLLAAEGCGSDSSSGPKTPDFTLMSESTSLALAPGASKRTFVKATRIGGYAGPISFGVSGVNGLAVSIGDTSAPDSERVDIAVPANSPAGNHDVIMTASGPGALTQRVTIAVVVTPAAGVASPSVAENTGDERRTP